MTYLKFQELVLTHLILYKNNVLGITKNGIWKNNKKAYSHILPEDLIDLNFLPMTKPITGLNMTQKINFHSGAHHLNSSQIMCINFFSPLLRDDEGLSILKTVLEKEINIKFANGAYIQKACFEYTPDSQEKTSFDFFVEMSTGKKIFFEIKYTENRFGSIHIDPKNPSKYSDKWCNIYSSKIKSSLYLKGFSENDFYKNYQIWRNISYIVNNSDYVVFLFPFSNKVLTKEVNNTIGFPKSKRYPNVSAQDWSSFVKTALNLTKNTKYYFHFHLFYEKYFI